MFQLSSKSMVNGQFAKCIFFETGLPPPIALCHAKGVVRDFLMELRPFDPKAPLSEADVFAVTLDLDDPAFPIHWWGKANGVEDIHAHLLSVFRRENPYLRVLALCIIPRVPSLLW